MGSRKIVSLIGFCYSLQGEWLLGFVMLCYVMSLQYICMYFPTCMKLNVNQRMNMALPVPADHSFIFIEKKNSQILLVADA